MEVNNSEMLLYSMDKAFEEMKYVMCREDECEMEVYYRIGTCLHWLIDCYDRIKKKIKKEDEMFFNAFKAANNCQKHIKELESLHIVSRGGYAHRYPRHYGTKYNWESIEYIELRYQKEKDAYMKILYGNNVISTLDNAKKLITEYYREQR